MENSQPSRSADPLVSTLSMRERLASLLPWLVLVTAFSVIPMLRGFHYPVGHGWSDEMLDFLGIAMAIGGTLATGLWSHPTPISHGQRGAALCAAGSGLALIVGQLILAAGFALLYTVFLRMAIHRSDPFTAPPSASRPARPWLARTSLLNGFCAIATLVILFEVWEDLIAPGGAKAHLVELGFFACCLHIIGVILTATADRGATKNFHRIATSWGSSRAWFAIGIASFLGFLALALVIQFPAVRAWDAALVRSVHLFGGRGVRSFMHHVSDAGGRDLLTIWLLPILGVVWLRAGGRSVRFAVATLFGTLGLEIFFKSLFHRSRPEFTRGVHLDSFPSGHTLAAMVLAGVLFTVLLPLARTRFHRTVLTVAAVAWPVLMGASRVYLGRHFLTDVVGGLLLGIAWVCFCQALRRLLRNVEPTN